MMSAKDTDVDKAVGLGLGADDYICKPFSMIELAARVKAGIRRSTKYSATETTEKMIQIGDLTIDQLILLWKKREASQTYFKRI